MPVSVQPSLFLKTCRDCSRQTAETILLSFSLNWQTSGRWTSRGESWTANSSPWPRDGAACSLSQILEVNVPPKYLLSPKACMGILRRAEKRGKELPEALHQALQRRAGEPHGQGNPEDRTR